MNGIGAEPEPVNARRPEYERYRHDRDQRRADAAAAADREARERAPDPVRKVLDGGATARRAAAEFDQREGPELTYEQWKAAGA